MPYPQKRPRRRDHQLRQNALRTVGLFALVALLTTGVIGPVGLLAQTPAGFDSITVVSAVRLTDDANPQLHHNIPRLEVEIGGQALVADFVAFYEASGGLVRWGLATSEVLVEEEGTLTQYYQRGIVDFHQRLDLGGIYVMERRLTWDYFGGGLAGSPDLGVEPGTTNNNSGEEHGPWGHKVSNFSVGGVRTNFLEFFRAYGGVDAFGLPKTEARIDTNQPSTVHIPAATPGFIRQYFQAAVFEHHEGVGVQLRLLGDDVRDRLYPNGAWQTVASFGAAPPLVEGEAYEAKVVEFDAPTPATPTPSVTPTPSIAPSPTATPAASLPSTTNELVLVGTSDAGIAIYDGEWTSFSAAATDLSDDAVQALHVDRDGMIWVGTPTGLVRLGRDGKGETFNLATTGNAIGASNVQAIAGRQDGDHLYLGHPGRGASIFDGTAWKQLRPDNSDLPDADVRDIFVVDEALGRVWFATTGGAALYERGTDTWPRILLLANTPGLTSNNYRAVAIDAAARLWLGSFGDGAARSSNLIVWTVFTTNEDLGSNEIRDVLVAANGDVWVATAGGVSRVDNGGLVTYTTANSGFPADGANALAETADGRVWAATDGGVGVFNGAAWTTYTTADGVVSNATTSIAVAPAVPAPE